MKLLAAAALTLVGTLSTAFAAEEFGGIKFHSSIPKIQVETLKTDLRYLYQNPLIKADQQFMTTAQIAGGDGQNLHNWLLNRVRYIVGENFKLDEPNIIGSPYDRFPNTPIPDAFKAITADGGGVKTVMTNIGGALYLVGKSQKTLFGIKFDGETVYAKGARIGLLQVGEGLFLERFLLNKNPLAVSNSISRLGTLFHEARHSDGNGKSTGFLHFTCPAGHAYATFAACEASANGSYTIGGLSERHMLANCSSCNKQEQNALAAKVVDSFSRILNISPAAAEISNQINQLKTIYAQYTAMLPTLKPADKAKVQAELVKIKPMIAQLEAQYKVATAKPVKPSPLDPRPEGLIVMITVPQSSAAMNRSLQK